MAAQKKASAKRELIAPKGDKRYTRRTSKGKFGKNQDDVGRALSKDVKQRARKTVKSGHGDEGDQKRRSAKKRR